MKKSALILVLISLMSVALMPSLVLAQDLEDAIKANLEPIEDVYDPIDDVRPGTLQEILAKLIRRALIFLGVLMILLIVYGGFTWMTAAGNDENITKAKKIITAAIIGLAIILTAYAITVFVFDVLLEATGTYT